MCVCVCVCVCVLLIQLCLILCDPMDHSPPDSSMSMTFPKQEHWSGLPCPPPGNLPDPGIKFESLLSPALAGSSFTTSTTREAQNQYSVLI